MSSEQKIADVLSRLKCLSEELIDMNTRKQAVGWMSDASTAMEKAFELINEQLVEIEDLRKDSDRYRWLKVERRPAADLDAAFNAYGVPIDEAIDAAMAKEKSK